MSRWSCLHLGPPLHEHVRPPASWGTLCSKSAWVAGRRQVGAVQVACRIWVRCRSLRPGSCPAASNLWSQVSVAIGSSVRVGDVLAEIDQKELGDEVAATASELARLREEDARMTRLDEDEAILGFAKRAEAVHVHRDP